MASSTEGPMNRSAQSRHRPSSTRLPSTRIRRQSGDSAPWATINWRATDLPPPGSPPISMFRSARVPSTRRPSSSVPKWTGFQMDSGATGMDSAAITGHLLGGRRVDHVDGHGPGNGDGQSDPLAAVGAHRAAAGGAVGGGDLGFQDRDAVVA